MSPSRLIGLAAILVALGYNVLFTLLSIRFDYPDILRRPVAEILARLAEGGPGLLLVWYGFALSALAFALIAPGLALGGRRATAASVTAAILGALAGAVQAMGLMRWVFAVPLLTDPALPGREAAFVVLHAWGGVALGETLGQMLTAGFLGAMAVVAMRDGARVRAGLALLAAALIAVGAQEGAAKMILGDPGPLPLVAVAGYLGLSLWLVAEGGARLLRR